MLLGLMKSPLTNKVSFLSYFVNNEAYVLEL